MAASKHRQFAELCEQHGTHKENKTEKKLAVNTTITAADCLASARTLGAAGEHHSISPLAELDAPGISRHHSPELRA